MSVIEYILLPLIGSVFILYAIFHSMERIGINIAVNIRKKNLIVLVYIVITLGFALLGNGIINLILLLLIPLIGHFLYNNQRLFLVYYIGFVVAIYLTDILVMFAMQLIFENGIIYYADPNAYNIVLIVAVRFIEFMVLKILVWLIQRMHHERITGRQMISSFIMPTFSIVNLFSMMTFLEYYMSEENMFLFTVNMLMLVGLNIYFTSVFDILSRNNYLKNELNLYKQQQEIQTRYYENLDKKYDSTRKLVHDVRNHIQAMQHLYEEQNREAGGQYAKDVHDMLNQLGQQYYTSNQMLNIILNDKIQRMHEHGLTEDIRIADSDLSFIRNVDITTLFANILDNAIEAAENSGDKKIMLRVATVHDFITITLKNSMDTEPIRIADNFQSTKDNHDGFGLKNVIRVVEKYKGDVQYEWRDHYFITRIMFAV